PGPRGPRRARGDGARHGGGARSAGGGRCAVSLGDLVFQQPWALLGLLLLPLTWAPRRRPVLRLPTQRALRSLDPGPRARLGWLPRALRSLALALGVLALARPAPPAAGGQDRKVAGIESGRAACG